MNDWKELRVDNLPPDILTGDYEFQVLEDGIWDNVFEDSNMIKTVIDYLLSGTKYRYRKPDPKQPTHEEFLQRVKKELNIQIDTKVADMKKSIIFYMNKLYDCLESADIPPEAEIYPLDEE